jgi:peptide/nickel transport system permease protein
VVVVERVFNVPGLGSLMVQAINDRDLPVVQAVTMVFAATYIAANLIADCLAVALNPRLRRSGT